KPVRLLPFDDPWQQSLRFEFISDEIVVNQKAAAKALGEDRVKLGQNLFRTFDARTPAEDSDNVAKLAEKGTTTRELHRRGTVPSALQKIETRNWHRRHVRFLGLLVTHRGRRFG